MEDLAKSILSVQPMTRLTPETEALLFPVEYVPAPPKSWFARHVQPAIDAVRSRALSWIWPHTKER